MKGTLANFAQIDPITTDLWVKEKTISGFISKSCFLILIILTIESNGLTLLRLKEIRRYSKRPIIVRFHRALSGTQQKDFDRLTNYIGDRKDITIQSKANNNYPDIVPVIKNAYAVCTWSSSSATPAICEGKPLYVKSKNCFFYDMNSGDIKDIEEPNIKDKRDKWFANYAATHYNLKDLNTGYYFGKVKNLIWYGYLRW